MEEIWRINKQGPFLGIVVPNAFEMNPLLQSPSFVQDSQLPYFDFGGIYINRYIYIYISVWFTFYHFFLFLIFLV